MTDENAKKKYKFLKGLIAGNMKTGNPVQDDLIVSDAKKHMADLILKRPNIDFEPKVEVKPKEAKAKEKK